MHRVPKFTNKPFWVLFEDNLLAGIRNSLAVDSRQRLWQQNWGILLLDTLYREVIAKDHKFTHLGGYYTTELQCLGCLTEPPTRTATRELGQCKSLKAKPPARSLRSLSYRPFRLSMCVPFAMCRQVKDLNWVSLKVEVYCIGINFLLTGLPSMYHAPCPLLQTKHNEIQPNGADFRIWSLLGRARGGG